MLTCGECDPFCPTENCVTDEVCSLCHNPLCDTCRYFTPNSCETCYPDNTTYNPATDDCTCDATHVLDDTEKTCKCHARCTECSELDYLNCRACAPGYFL
jgi:hypothetical protein